MATFVAQSAPYHCRALPPRPETKDQLRQRLLHIISSLRRENCCLKYQRVVSPISSFQPESKASDEVSKVHLEPPTSISRDSACFLPNQSAEASSDTLPPPIGDVFIESSSIAASASDQTPASIGSRPGILESPDVAIVDSIHLDTDLPPVAQCAPVHDPYHKRPHDECYAHVVSDAEIIAHDQSLEVTDSGSTSSVSCITATPVVVLTKSQKKRMKKKSKVQSVTTLDSGASVALSVDQLQPVCPPLDGVSDANSDWYTALVHKLNNTVGIANATFTLELDQHFEPHCQLPVIHIQCSAPDCKGHYTLPLPPCPTISVDMACKLLAFDCAWAQSNNVPLCRLTRLLRILGRHKYGKRLHAFIPLYLGDIDVDLPEHGAFLTHMRDY